MDEDGRTYRVVVNAEEQHSLWPTDRGLPDGWREEGTRGTESECVARIEEVWPDIRPLRLRRRLSDAQS